MQIRMKRIAKKPINIDSLSLSLFFFYTFTLPHAHYGFRGFSVCVCMGPPEKKKEKPRCQRKLAKAPSYPIVTPGVVALSRNWRRDGNPGGVSHGAFLENAPPGLVGRRLASWRAKRIWGYLVSIRTRLRGC